MKAAIVQQSVTCSKESNLRRGLENLARAADMGAELICYSELSFETFYPQNLSQGHNSYLAEAIPGPITEAFQEASARYGVVSVINIYERDGIHCFDTSPVIDADGRLLGKTRMVHITDYEGFHEQGYYTPGDLGAPVFSTRIGKLGVAICYDRHFPEYMRALAVQGAEVVVIPQAGVLNEWPEGLYEAEVRATAFTNGYFAILANRTGHEDKLSFAGESFACDPDGRVIARAGRETNEILMFEIDVSQVQESHARKHLIPDRRPELYGRWI